MATTRWRMGHWLSLTRTPARPISSCRAWSLESSMISKTCRRLQQKSLLGTLWPTILAPTLSSRSMVTQYATTKTGISTLVWSPSTSLWAPTLCLISSVSTLFARRWISEYSKPSSNWRKISWRIPSEAIEWHWMSHYSLAVTWIRFHWRWRTITGPMVSPPRFSKSTWVDTS